MRLKNHLAIFLLALAPVLVFADDLKDAIVKIYSVVNIPDYYNPWSMRGTASGTGSGAILKGRKILTNAHVVGNQTFIQVRRYGEARRYTARVVSVSHEADLALLTVDDPDFFSRGPSLELGELPDPQEEVLVYGFPLGGDTLSITKGVISRIEHQTYAHASARLLAGQMDAAINPGNSGGPVIQDGKIVGVVMQGLTQADNIGYMVPANLIQHFFTDLEDGRSDGFPSLGVVLQELENPDLKRKNLLPADKSGTLVTRVMPGSPADGLLRPGDILQALDGHAIADDGTVEFRPRQRTSLSYWVQEKQVGDSITLDVFRDGNPLALTATLFRASTADALVADEQYDVRPSYYIYGGIVFCPLTKNLLKAWGPNWYANAPNNLMSFLDRNFPEVNGEQVILALKVLAADVNQGYHAWNNWVVESVDGQRVRTMKELIAAVESAKGGDFITFGDGSGRVLVLDRKKAAASHASLLNTYRIPDDRSPDLMK